MNETSVWVVVPAAGAGKRMQSAVPKQYLHLCGRPVLQVTLDRLLSIKKVAGVVVALQDDDEYWQDIMLGTDKPVLRASGGEERSDSVLNALQLLSQQSGFNVDSDRVMVHDAVRPCVRKADVELLIETSISNAAGGLLAVPVRDTMKRRAKDGTVQQTVDRERLWHALTPQLFPFKLLRQALSSATQQGLVITDESCAVEQAGYSPLLVPGHEDNIKITRPGDLRLAELYLTELE